MITVFGLGFVGLTTALGFAHFGYKVYGIDISKERTDFLKEGKIPFLEPNLDKILLQQLDKNFIITDDAKIALKNSKFVFYCVGTPYGDSGEADLTYLFSAMEETLKHINKNGSCTLVIKSTVPPSSTIEKIIPFIQNHGFHVGNEVLVANNPEFLREGNCWDDFINADRIVIGSDDENAIENITNLYKPFNVPIFSVSYSSGEFIKYLSNTLLATMISYSNEMSIVADAIGKIDVIEAFNILHMDKRWNGASMASYVYPGCGYGGYCLPKDTAALYAISKKNGFTPKILENTIKLNTDMPDIITKKISESVPIEKTIGILGLSFKPNSSDVRDCASAKIIKKLLQKGYNILAYDPVATQEFIEIYNLKVGYQESLEEITVRADVLVILTAWKDFIEVKKTSDKMVLDFRYMR